MEYKIHTSQLKEMSPNLKVGDNVLLSGQIYTGRDAAHKRLVKSIQTHEKLPIELTDKVIYYAGPTPTPPGSIVGACGPTTSGRMDVFTPLLLQHGLLAMIGKGERSLDVVAAIKKYGAVYFCALGGAGALCAKSIKKVEIVCYEDLGCEAIRLMEIVDFPLIVGVDSQGRDIFRKS